MKSICDRCRSPFVLIGSTCLETSCNTAPVASYANNGICTPCDANCLTCDGASTHCLTCHDGYSLDVTTFKCSNLCLYGQYLDKVSKRCLPCDPNCKECFGGSQSECLTCTASNTAKPVYTLQSASSVGCYSQCPVKYYNNATT